MPKKIWRDLKKPDYCIQGYEKNNKKYIFLLKSCQRAKKSTYSISTVKILLYIFFFRGEI